MSRRTGLLSGTIQVALAHFLIALCTVPPAVPRLAPRPACDHGAPAGWQLRSTHETSAGAVAYARCDCGAWLVLLDGRPLGAAGHPRPRPLGRAPSTGGAAARAGGRGRLWSWDRWRALWNRTRRTP
jgi:hypothetical protein